MRQPTNDFREDPFKSKVGVGIPDPVMTPELAAHRSKFSANQAVFAAYNFCGKACLNLGTAKMGDAETACLEGCKSSYLGGIKLLSQEESTFRGFLSQIKTTGGDIYEARDI